MWLKSWNKWNMQKCAVWSQKTRFVRMVVRRWNLSLMHVDSSSSCARFRSLYAWQTQALSFWPLAPMGETQIIDGLDPEYKKRFMHHYNFPIIFCWWNWSHGAPGRRKYHGALVSVLCLSIAKLGRIPICDSFGSRSLESNGSSSQASIQWEHLPLWRWCANQGASSWYCNGSSISDGNNYTVLTDIQGLEDHFGDMGL